MAAPHADQLLRYIRKIAGRGAGVGAVSDAEALCRFVTQRDEAAFELLVWRHGAMVLNVCRGVLHDEHAAEDAFQGTFLILARKAAAVYRQASLAGWLYRVAYRIALKAQAEAKKRTTQGPEALDGVADRSAGEPAEALARREMQPLLYAEVNRLPLKYRDLVVLCYLQGQTNEEAARQLGSPTGTVLGRLARDLLRKRLTARGLVLPSGVFLASCPESSAMAAVPAALIVSTTQAALRFATGQSVSAVVSPHAAALAEGVIRAMFLTKVKVITMVVLALAILGAGAGAICEVGPFAAAARAPQQAADQPAAPEASARKRLIKVPSPIDGVIVVIGRELKVEKVPGTVRTREVKIEYRRLREGDRVEEGELLVRLDDRLARIELAVQKAKVTATTADLDAAVKTKLEAQVRLDRMDRLLVAADGKGAIVSGEDYSAAVLARDRYKYEEEAKKAGVTVAELDVERAEINLEKHAIRSPVRGVIRAIYKERGEAVQRLEAVVQIEILGDR